MSASIPTSAPWQTAARRIKNQLHQFGLGTVLLDADGRIFTLAGAEVREVGVYDDQVDIADLARDLEFCSAERPIRRIFNQPTQEETNP